MKFLILLTFLVVILVATTQAQRPTRRPGCPQEASPTRCSDPRNVGNTCPRNAPRRMWYYNSVRRACMPMQFLGCGGNGNRWCTKRGCERRCLPPRPRPQ